MKRARTTSPTLARTCRTRMGRPASVSAGDRQGPGAPGHSRTSASARARRIVERRHAAGRKVAGSHREQEEPRPRSSSGMPSSVVVAPADRRSSQAPLRARTTCQAGARSPGKEGGGTVRSSVFRTRARGAAPRAVVGDRKPNSPRAIDCSHRSTAPTESLTPYRPSWLQRFRGRIRGSRRSSARSGPVPPPRATNSWNDDAEQHQERVFRACARAYRTAGIVIQQSCRPNADEFFGNPYIFRGCHRAL